MYFFGNNFYNYFRNVRWEYYVYSFNYVTGLRFQISNLLLTIFPRSPVSCLTRLFTILVYLLGLLRIPDFQLQKKTEITYFSNFNFIKLVLRVTSIILRICAHICAIIRNLFFTRKIFLCSEKSKLLILCQNLQ